MDNTGKALKEWLRIALAQGRRIERLGVLVTEGELTPEEAWEELVLPVRLEGLGQVVHRGTFVARLS